MPSTETYSEDAEMIVNGETDWSDMLREQAR